MSSTILVVIVLVVMWLVVLVPMFVHRHEEDGPDSADWSASRTRVLARRAPPGRRTGPYQHRPPADHSEDAPSRAGIAAAAFSRDQARRRMMRRRRRTLLLLATLAGLGAAGGTLVTAWFWAVHLLGTVLLAGYAGWLRQQVRRERARRLRRAALSARTAPAPFPAPLAHRRAPHPAPHRAAPRPTRRAGQPTAQADLATGVPTADGTWRPVPVPTPTYVTKPAAHLIDPVVSLDDDDPAFADIDPVVEPIERRRAANG